MQPPLTRERIATVVLLLLAGAGAVLCVIIAWPFLPALTWALAIVVVAHPVHDWMARRVTLPNLAAGLSVTVITIGLLAPSVWIGREIAKQATRGFEEVQGGLSSGELASRLKQNPTTARLFAWAQANIDIEREVHQIGDALHDRLRAWVRGTLWTAVQVLVTIFVLFYLFRDRRKALRALRALLPLSDREADAVLERVRGMIHATIYGTLVVAAVQGTLGGIMFWILQLPAPLLWGIAMGLMAIIPVLGAYVIWVPAAVALALQGSWGKAAVLTVWGAVVVGLIDNLLYPILVGKEARLHTVPVFIAIVGGLWLFGASGLVLGPLVFALTLGLIDVLRRRTAGNRSAEEPT